MLIFFQASNTLRKYMAQLLDLPADLLFQAVFGKIRGGIPFLDREKPWFYFSCEDKIDAIFA